MLLAYLDESRSPAHYFIAGLLIPDTEARSLTAALDEVVEEASYEHGRIASTAELHGYEIVNATGAWKRHLDITGCQLMRVQEGRIADVRGHYSDQHALDAFWKTG